MSSKRLYFIAAVLGLALCWNTRPGRLVRGSVQSGVDAMIGAQTVEIGQTSRRELLQANLALAVRRYEAMHGEAPRDPGDLVHAGLLQSADLEDEWGRALVVEPRSGGFALRSRGADGAAGTADDWTLVGSEPRDPETEVTP